MLRKVANGGPGGGAATGFCAATVVRQHKRGCISFTDYRKAIAIAEEERNHEFKETKRVLKKHRSLIQTKCNARLAVYRQKRLLSNILWFYH